MNIIIQPFAARLPSGLENAKNYPHWEKLVELLEAQGHDILQVGVFGEKQLVQDFRPNLSLKEHKEMLDHADMFICVDSWYQHFAHYYGKRGIVLFGPSNPRIFGWKENMNLFADAKYFRKYQFDIWHSEIHKPEAFVSAEEVVEWVKTFEANNVLIKVF